jgi:hypothetical protein
MVVSIIVPLSMRIPIVLNLAYGSISSGCASEVKFLIVAAFAILIILWAIT